MFLVTSHPRWSSRSRSDGEGRRQKGWELGGLFSILTWSPPQPLTSTHSSSPRPRPAPAHCPSLLPPSREGGAGVLGARPRGTSDSLYDVHSLSRPGVPPLRLLWQHLLPAWRGSKLVFMKPARDAWHTRRMVAAVRTTRGLDRLSCPCPHFRSLLPHPSDSFWPWSLWLNSGRPLFPLSPPTPVSHVPCCRVCIAPSLPPLWTLLMFESLSACDQRPSPASPSPCRKSANGKMRVDS